jgi:uncharacterized protein (DUF433 family)
VRKGVFTAAQAAKLANVSQQQLAAWRTRGILRPSYDGEFGETRIYSFREVVALKVLGVLRGRYGVTPSELARVAAWLQCHHDEEWPGLRLLIADKRVLFTPAESEGGDGVEACARVDVGEIAAEVESAFNSLRVRTGEQIGKISRHPKILRNTPVLAGTRIPTSAIKNFSDAGYSASEIVREYPTLTEADVEAALRYEASLKQRVG